MKNNNLDFEKCYMESIKVVLNHDQKEDVILSFGSMLKQLAKNLNGVVKQTNAGEGAPPDLPRALILSKTTNVSVSLNKIEVEIKGDRKHNHIDRLQDIHKNRFKEIEGIISTYLSREEFEEQFIGIISSVRFPQLNNLKKKDIVSSLSQGFLKKGHDNLVNFSLQLGFESQIGDFFRNYNIKDYEVKNITLPKSQSNEVINVDISSLPTVEKGVLVIVDVNNRPQKDSHEFKVDLINIREDFFRTIKDFGTLM